MRFEVLVALNMLMLVFCVITPCGQQVEGGNSVLVRYFSIYLVVHSELQSRRKTSAVTN
jgi:hypothetical protein